MATQYPQGSRQQPSYPRPPPGWAPPFPGAPPMPQGAMINPQAWQMGSWQFNPAYNHQRFPGSQSQWMPAPAWIHPAVPQPVNPPPGFNPYKKVIKPPSAEYLATKLTDNGLDLHNMIPAVNPYGDEEGGEVPKTPWIWNPTTLQNDAPSVSAQRAAATAAAAAANNRLQFRHSSEPPMSSASASAASKSRHATEPNLAGSHSAEGTPSSSSSPTAHSAASSQTNLSSTATLAELESFSTVKELKPTFSSNIIRTPEYYRRPSSVSTTSSREHPHSSVDSLSERLSTSITISTPADSHLNASQASSISGEQLVDEPGSILSPLLVAGTPKSNPQRPLERGSTYPSLGHKMLSTIAESPPITGRGTPDRTSESSESSTRTVSPSRDASRPQPIRANSQPEQRHNSAPPIIPSHNPHISDAPRRSFLQQHTPPDADSGSPPPREGTPRRHIDIYAPGPSKVTTPIKNQSQLHRSSSEIRANHTPTREQSPPSSSNQSPSRELYRTASTTSFAASHNHSSEQPRSPKYTPPRSSLHAPPLSPRTYEEPRPEPIKLVIRYTPMPPPPGAQKRHRRIGYWNRRGDHCTKEGYLVYAPPGQTYPEDLNSYPEDGAGYENQFGHIGVFDPKRPELPESLPRHGRPPITPYSEFLKYDWF